jgi:hypothetical protein
MIPVRAVVYDTGMLIGLANRAARPHAEHRQIIRYARPIVPGPVLSQAWRGGATTTQAVLSRYLRDCLVYTAYSELDYKRVGVLLGDVVLPPKKRPDVIDALVVLTAARHDPAAVVTSDTADIAAYLDALPKARAVLVPV